MAKKNTKKASAAEVSNENMTPSQAEAVHENTMTSETKGANEDTTPSQIEAVHENTTLSETEGVNENTTSSQAEAAHENTMLSETEGANEDTMPSETDEVNEDATPSQAEGDDENTAPSEADDEGSKSPDAEDMLDMHYMSFRQRISYKRAQYKKKTGDMTGTQRLRFFFDYYKWQAIFTVCGICLAVLLGRTIYLNSQPMALGLIMINNSQREDMNLEETIENDYRGYGSFGKYDRFLIIPGLSIDSVNYTNDVIATGSSDLSDYETLFYMTSAGSIDVILSDYEGVKYCVEQDLVYPIDMVFSEDILAPYADRLKVMTSYTGDERNYAIDVSDSPYLKEQGLKYSSAYIMFPSNIEENNERGLSFLKFLLEP